MDKNRLKHSNFKSITNKSKKGRFLNEKESCRLLNYEIAGRRCSKRVELKKRKGFCKFRMIKNISFWFGYRFCIQVL